MGIRLGHTCSGEEVCLEPSDLRAGLLLLGRGATRLACSVAKACQEAGLRVLALDLEGALARQLRGHLPTVECQQVLYDLQRVEPGDREHARLVVLGYSSCLSLTAAQEGLLAALAEVALAQGPILSPAALGDMLLDRGGVLGEELRDRLASLSALNALGVSRLRDVIEQDCVFDFSPLSPFEARALGGWLLLAKLSRTIGEVSPSPSAAVLITPSHALFAGRGPGPHRPDRLLEALSSLGLGLAFASELWFLLDECLGHFCRLKVYTSEAWNRLGRGRGEEAVLEGEAVLEDAQFSSHVTFYPSWAEPKGPLSAAVPEAGPPDEELQLQLLAEVAKRGQVTRAGLVSYFAPRHGRAGCERALDRLMQEGLIGLQVREAARGVRVLVLVPTQKGLLRLKGHGLQR